MPENQIPIEEEEVAEDLEMQLAKIADQLSELSRPTQTPQGFASVTESFEPDEVDFESSGWLLRVLQVQAWLNLDAEVSVSDAEENPTESGLALFRSLRAADPRECIGDMEECLKLSEVGADILSGRLDTATRLQEDFVEFLETDTRRQATERWLELWEEEEPQEAQVDPIRAKTAVWPIQDFSDKAARGRLNLSPSYQRGDVWPTADAQKLIESVLRGIPLPSVIILKPRGGNAIFEVVDGKQRLTSLLRFIGKHPSAIKRVEEAHELHPNIGFTDLFHTDYKKFRRLWKTHMGEALSGTKEAKYYFPFMLPKTFAALPGGLADLAGKFYYQIQDEIIEIGTEEESVREIFEAVSEYRVPVIIYQDAAPRQIHEVFHLYNRQGKHLNAEEIRNALFHDLDLMRLLLVASGDNSNCEELAPYIPESTRPMLSETAEILSEYRFGTSRYKRTKLLGWLLALAMQPALQEDGELAIRSTAKQIDSLLEGIRTGIKNGKAPWLADHTNLEKLASELHRCLDVHSSCECWSGGFKDDKDGVKWQELQLVASLLGVFLVCALVEEAGELLESKQDELLEFTRNHLRPEKTQNKTQWGFIGEVALGIVETVGLDVGAASEKMVGLYSVDCIATLSAARQHYSPRRII